MAKNRGAAGFSALFLKRPLLLPQKRPLAPDYPIPTCEIVL
jgi:hypothetical protein